MGRRETFFGYGLIKVNRKTVKTHRVAWELANGIIPEGLSVLHHCDNPACINPEHLFLGTHADNMADRNAKGRQSRGPYHALKGEECGRAKLTEGQVKEIRSDRRSSEQIASDYAVSRRNIGMIKKRETWKHVS